MQSTVLLLLTTAALVSGRDAKWFLRRNTVTQVVYQQRSQTLVVPSSCVVIEPSLKPCRHLRQLQATPVSRLPRIVMTASPRVKSEQHVAPSLQPSEGEAARESWASYLGLGDVTITHTVTQFVTARMASPAAVVTFSVRGCRPTRLPFDLPLCLSANVTAANTTTSDRTTNGTTRDIHFLPEQP